jgi:hypothetical protein
VILIIVRKTALFNSITNILIQLVLTDEYSTLFNKILISILNVSHRTRRQYSKRTKRWRPVKFLEPKKYTYIPGLIKKVFEERALSGGGVNRVIGLSPDDPRNVAHNIAAVPAPTINSLIECHKSRFT